MKTTILGVIVFFVLPAGLSGTTRIDLNADWSFRTDATQTGERSNWQERMPSNAESVSIPHTWNLGRSEGYLGKAWYFKTFDLPTQADSSHVKLHFGATFYIARIWLNGVEVGTHEGGYTAYWIDITRNLRRTNYLAVEIDNRVGAATIPGLAQRGEPQAWYDWWDYGGIVREVWLTVGGPIQVLRQRIRTSEIGEDKAIVEDSVFVENNLPRRELVSAMITVLGPDNQAAGRETHSVSLAPGVSPITLAVKLWNPELWGIDHPSMYRMVVELAGANGALLDENNDTFGVRKVEIRDRHLVINGERVRLTGLARHEDSSWEGLAETAGTMLHDYDDMKALQVTLTRPVHYPQNHFILDYADRHGILLVPEIPVWQFSENQMKDPRVLALAKQQMREMIEEAGNHPSIFAWSVCNESDTSTPGGIAYFRAMRDFIHQVDSGRYVSYADDHLPKLQRAEQSAANDTDFIMMNQYFGSWHGPAADLSDTLDRIGKMFPDKMAIISEFGYAGIFAKHPEDADPARVRIIEEQMPELARRDWIAGAILWCYQDYKSRRNLRSGRDSGYVEHGLVDEFRQRKPSYYIWKDLNAPASIGVRWEQAAGSMPTGFSLKVEPNSSALLPSYPLHNYRLLWDVCGPDGKLLADGDHQFAELAVAQTISGEISPQPGSTALKLHVTLLRPTGAVAAEKVLNWQPAGMAAQTGVKVVAADRSSR